jgi:hypothetical protein
VKKTGRVVESSEEAIKVLEFLRDKELSVKTV